MKKTISMLKDDSGAALMMAIFTVTMLMVIATEIMYQSSVELVVSGQAINNVKAHYAARAGLEISLLRIQIFRKASAMVGDSVPASMLDPIWQMPFAWPPFVPEGTSEVDKGEIKKAVKNSTMQGQYFATIESESGKIDVNDLASPSKVIADATRAQILQIFQSRVDGDESFATQYRGYDFNKLVNNLTDWVDPGKESKNGGDKSAFYPDRTSDRIPPGEPFKTIEELHMVADMNDQLFEMLASRLTVFGAKGINVNQAGKEVLMSLSPQITPERADRIIEMRGKPERGPFKDEGDFVGFLNTIGVTGNPFREGEDLKVPLIFDTEHNFRIRSTGRSGKNEKTITAVVFDYDQVKGRLSALLATPTPTPAAPKPGEPAPPPPTPTPKPSKPKVPNERPNIVYWNET